MYLDNLVNKLIDDEEILHEIKLEMLKEWEERMIDSNASRIMSKEDMGQHMSNLEILHNAKERLSTEKAK